MSAEPVRERVWQAEVDEGKARVAARKRPRRWGRFTGQAAELERRIEILAAATGFFARAHELQQG